MKQSLVKRLVAEALGTTMLLAAVVGSGLWVSVWPGETLRSRFGKHDSDRRSTRRPDTGLWSTLALISNSGSNTHRCLAKGDCLARESFVYNSTGRRRIRRSVARTPCLGCRCSSLHTMRAQDRGTAT